MVRKSVGVACACFLSGAMLAVQPYVSSATANADPIEKLAGEDGNGKTNACSLLRAHKDKTKRCP